MIRIHQCGGGNIGDMITLPIVEHFLKKKVVNVKNTETGKLLGVGSIISWAVKENDIVWGSGLISDQKIELPPCKVLALRGMLTAENINSDCNVFGDPALLLPFLYNPTNIKKEHKVGVIEHYVDKNLYNGEGHRISVWMKWKEFIDEVLKCEKIVSSSLHGCVIPEAYGIPVEWIELSNKVIGKGFKFRDYLSGTKRTSFSEEFDLKSIQNKLIEVLQNEFNTTDKS